MIKGWNKITNEQSRELQNTYKNCNWGLLLGHPDTNYVDVDVEVDAVYQKLETPETTEFGRKSRRYTGHLLYKCLDLDGKNYKYYNADKVLLFELRSQGLVTIPKSYYDENDDIDYNRYGYPDYENPVEISYKLLKQKLEDFYLTYVISELYPNEGARQDAVLGFTSWLLKNKVKEDQIKNMFENIFKWNDDRELTLRQNAIVSTIDKFNSDPGSVSGITKLKEIYLTYIISFLQSIFKSSDKIDVVEFFNELYNFINNPKGIWDVNYNCYVELQQLRNQYAHKKITQANEGKIKVIKAIDYWLESEQKTVMEQIIYAPGKTFGDKINTWKGWGVQPIQYNEITEIGPMLHLLYYLFESTNEQGEHITNEAQVQWFLNWLSYPLQNPGEKNHTAVLLYSRHQGVGKNLIGYIMQDIYGDNFIQLGDDAFGRQFNDYLMSKQFIIGNELTSSERFSGVERLKMLITEPYIEINRKFQPVLEIKNCINILLLSNNPDPLLIKQLDRRFFIWYIDNPPLGDAFYQSIFIPWRKSGGSGKFFQYLLDRDLSGYSAQGHAPMTMAKAEIQDMQKSSLEFMLHERLIKEDTPELVTVSWLYHMYLDETGDRLTPLKIGRAMAGYDKKRRMTVGKKGGQITVWAIKNELEWHKKPNSMWARYLNKDEIL